MNNHFNTISTMEDKLAALGGIKTDGTRVPLIDKSQINETRTIALKYCFGKRWSIIPIRSGSHVPLVKEWTPYQDKRATSQEISEWFPHGSKRNIGIITGKVSNIVVLDIDEKKGQSGSASLEKHGYKVPETVTAKTPNGGKHYYFKYPTDMEINCPTLGLEGVEVKGNGGKVEAFPSTLANGSYEWELSPDLTVIAEMPDWLKELCRSANQKKQDKTAFVSSAEFDPDQKTTNYGRKGLEYECEKLSKVPKGGRNNALNTAAAKMGNLIAGGHLNEEEAREALYRACEINGSVNDENQTVLATIEKGITAGLQRSRGPEKKSDQVGGLILRPVSDFKSKAIEWLWDGILAKGTPSLLVGDPGLGKSTMALSLAAIVSTGGQWPGGGGKADISNVVLLSAEDTNTSAIVKPRLDANKADTSKVLVLDSKFNIENDLADLSSIINTLGGTSLIIIDPLSSYFGKGRDLNKMDDARYIMDLLAELGTMHNATVLCIHHPNKKEDLSAINRIGGSGGIVAAARSALMLTKDKDDPLRREVTQIKNNYGPDRDAFGFSLTQIDLGKDEEGKPITGQRIDWETETFEKSAAEAIQKQTSEGGAAILEATGFLTELLKDGPMLSSAVKFLADEVPISDRTLIRAKEKLGVKSDWKIEKGKSYWTLPSDTLAK
jgi:hypothetical protein